MKDVSKFWNRRWAKLNLMALNCLRQILYPADIIVPAMMFCDDIKSHIFRHFSRHWGNEMSAYAIVFQVTFTIKAKKVNTPGVLI
jgi:hypothetical protein